MAPFRRVVRVAKPIVKARKPQSCALFSSRNQPSAPGCQQFCSQLPAILLPVARHSASRGSPSAPAGPAFYLRGPGLCSHSTFYLPKGSLSPSRFCFSVPNVQYYVPKPTITTSRPTSPVTRAQKPRFCARNALKRGFRRPKAHKNLNFVLETPEYRGSRPQKRTKTSILCSKSPKTRVAKAKKAQKPRFCAREDRKVASGIVKVAFLQITAHTCKI